MIARTLSEDNAAIVFQGFIEKHEEDADSIKGIIRFTNGVPYYYVSNGTAEIEIRNDGGITITMLYTPDFATLEQLETPAHFKFPAKLILEF
jgi:hypothetical protein